MKSSLSIAYLVPEYPGQTHVFFHREINAIEEMGINVDVISTRRPPPKIICHEWSEQAMQATKYLIPISLIELLASIRAVMAAGVIRWWRCIKTIFHARDASIKDKLRMVLLVLVTGRVICLARQHQWQHIHVHSCADSAILALFANLLAGIPYSMTLHGPLSIYGPVQPAKWYFASFGITVTKRLKSELLKAVAHIPASKIHVAPMGVDLNVFSRDSEYPRQPINGYWHMISCGRLHLGKGYQDVIRSVGHLRKNGWPVKLTILGEGQARKTLESLINKLKLDDVVQLIGAASEKRVRDELEKAHLFVLGSHDEAIGVATMEAMAMGLPVVVTDVGGVRELVRDGVDGRLVPPRSPMRMAAAIAELLEDIDAAANMGKNGCERVRRYFDCRISAKLIAEQLHRLNKNNEKPTGMKPAEIIA